MKPGLSTRDRTILAIHTVAALGLGTAAYMDTSSDADGMGGLARVVILIIVGLWMAGVVVSAATARFAIVEKRLRTLVVTMGPVAGVLALVIFARV